MKKITIITALIIFSLAIIAYAAPNSNSIVQDGIEYYIQTDKSVYNLGEEVEMLYRVTNLGVDDVTFHFGDQVQHYFTVKQNENLIWDVPKVGFPGGSLFVLPPSGYKEYNETWDMFNNQGILITPSIYDVTGSLHPVLLDQQDKDRYVPVSVQIEIVPELAKTYYVNVTDGNDNNDGLSPQTAFATIQSAIDAVVDGDVVIVAPGTYTGPGNRDIDFLGKAITVRSTDPNDPNIVAATIIDCNGTEDEPHRGFYFHSGEKDNSVIAGFTITNGYGPKNKKFAGQMRSVAGAILCRGSSPAIKCCTINGNSSERYGGGILCEHSSPTIDNCTISENSTGEWSRGGGIHCWYSGPNISNCIIRRNSAGYGGGICCDDRSDLIINQCLISSNLSHYWGGIDCERSNITISCCTIVDNSVSDGGGGILCWKSNAKISNSILWGNNAIRYGSEIALTNSPNPSHLAISNTDIEGGQAGIFIMSNCTVNWGPGNIDADPCFIQPGYWADANDANIIVEPNDPNAIWVDGDYHLLPTSPCIDAGDPNYIPEPNETDLDGNPRINGGRIDMGAYESPVPTEIDIDPHTLNLPSEGKWLTCHIWLPEDYNVADIDPNSVFLEDEIQAEWIWFNKKQQILTAKFSRSALQDILNIGDIELTVTSELMDGTRFKGTDTIRVIDKGRKSAR